MKRRSLILALGLASLASSVAPTAPAQDLDPAQVSSWPGYLRGAAGVVAASGKDAYVGAGTLLVVDARQWGQTLTIDSDWHGRAGSGTAPEIPRSLQAPDPGNPRISRLLWRCSQPK